jgi:hypothetical protein
MLTTNGRKRMAAQAIDCFRNQTYWNRSLLIWDTGAGSTVETKVFPDGSWIKRVPSIANDSFIAGGTGRQYTIGELRNQANGFACDYMRPADLFAHWDDDDYSYPRRLEEQVTLMEQTGADATGYNDILFWRITKIEREAIEHGEAWLYRNPLPNYALGTSLMYRREAWEKKPFRATSQGEDEKWRQGIRLIAISSLGISPRMVARIHSGNTSNGYTDKNLAKAEWKRVWAWDESLRSVFA